MTLEINEYGRIPNFRRWVVTPTFVAPGASFKAVGDSYETMVLSGSPVQKAIRIKNDLTTGSPAYLLYLSTSERGGFFLYI